MSNENPPECPKCGSRKVEFNTEREYTGGGFQDTYDLFTCENCGFQWADEERSEYY